MDHYTQNPVDPGVQFGEQSFMFPDSIGPTDRWAVFACTSPLSTSSRLRKNSADFVKRCLDSAGRAEFGFLSLRFRLGVHYP